MSFAKKVPAVALAVSGLVMTGAGVAYADNKAIAVSNGSPGLVSGIAFANNVPAPLNNCGTGAGAVLTAIAQNVCVNR